MKKLSKGDVLSSSKYEYRYEIVDVIEESVSIRYATNDDAGEEILVDHDEFASDFESGLLDTIESDDDESETMLEDRVEDLARAICEEVDVDVDVARAHLNRVVDWLVTRR